MCGIAVVSAKQPDREVSRMLAQLKHRGPDDSRKCSHGSSRVTVGHNRLAIIDPETGSQPFVDSHGAMALTNGEIYNHVELRSQLVMTDAHSESDAAVILPLFRHCGRASDLARRLDGMFAFVIVDHGGRVVAGRDPIGIKPLYRASHGDDFAYASELKSLLGRAWTKIETVQPGHVWDEKSTHPYYQLPHPVTGGEISETVAEHHVTRLRSALEEAVSKRLMSDVPLGAFLSGGIDSSIVTALAARHMSGLSTFSLGFEGSRDLEAARLVAEHLGTRHHEVIVSEKDLPDILPEVVYYLESWDRDLVRSALPTYLVAREAARDMKVVLTGEGADELFGGYRYHARYINDPDTLQHELHRSLAAMHDSNLQRVDRMTMAHSLEARVPFLDPSVVDVAMQIPAEMKLRRGPDGRPVEKWILRRAFADLLPSEIVWRPKSQFDEGSGAVDRLYRLAVSQLDGGIPHEPGARVRDVEEAFYFATLRSSLADWPVIQDNTSAWSRGRLAPAA